MKKFEKNLKNQSFRSSLLKNDKFSKKNHETKKTQKQKNLRQMNEIIQFFQKKNDYR